jgi:hypothetical protein
MNTKMALTQSDNCCESDPGLEAIARLAAIVNSSEDAISAAWGYQDSLQGLMSLMGQKSGYVYRIYF